MRSEQDILAGLKSGKEEAYRFLYEREYQILCMIAFKYTKDKYVAETIVSDVIFSIWLNRENVEIRTSLRSYLTRSVRNRCLNFLHFQGRTVRLDSQPDVQGQADFCCNEAGEYPIDILVEKELDLKISESIASMHALTSRIFHESRFNRLKYAEISDKLGISVDVVKYHIKIALSTLRKDLKEYLPLLICLMLFF